MGVGEGGEVDGLAFTDVKESALTTGSRQS